MRPSSAHKLPKSNKDLRSASILKRHTNPSQIYNQKSRLSWKTEVGKFQKPINTKLKTLGIIHAYRPDLLKECMVSQKSLIKGYNGGGECILKDIFLKSALAMFRDWREKINSKLTLLIEAVTESEEVLEPALEAKVRQAAGELKHYSSKIKHQIEELCSKGENFKLQRLSEKYTVLLETIQHVLRLVDCMRSLSSQVEAYLQAKKDSGFKSSQIEAGVRSIAEKHQKQASDSLNYCGCHPDNQLLLRLQFKARKMLVSSTQKVAAIFESIRQLQQYQTNFKKQMLFLENFQDFSHEYLGYVLQILYGKNQQLKLLQKRYQVAKMPEFVNLRAKIEDWETNFIKNLRQKSIKYLNSALRQLNGLRTLHLVRSKGKEYIQLKKRLIMLAKVYQESEKQSNLNAQYYQLEKKSVNQVIFSLNQAVSVLSTPIQGLPLQVEALQSHKQKKNYSGLKLVEKERQVIENIESIQRAVWSSTNSLYLRLSRIQGANPEVIEQAAYNDSKCLQKLHQLIFYSRNEEQTNEIFKQLAKSPTDIQQIQEILHHYDGLYSIHMQFAINSLEAGLERYRDLRGTLREQLVQYLFEDEFKSEFIAGYPAIKQVCLMEDKLIKAAGKQHINGIRFYRYIPSLVQELRRAVNQEIRKLQQSKYRGVFNKYIALIYECMLLQLLNTRQIHKLFVADESHLQPYRLIFHQYVQVYEEALLKGKCEETLFRKVTNKIYDICALLTQENRLVSEYNSSITTNQYYPSIQFLSEWLRLDFSAQVEGTVNRAVAMAKLEQVKAMFGLFMKRMQGQRQRLKVNSLKAEGKDIYQHISVNISLLRQFDFSEGYQKRLLRLMKYLQTLKIPYSAIFTKDEHPIYVFISSASQEEVSQMLLRMLAIGHQRQNHSFLIPFQYKHPGLTFNSSQSLAKVEHLSQPAHSKPVQDEMNQQIVVEEGIEQVHEYLIQDIQSSLPVASILKPQPTNHQLAQSIKSATPMQQSDKSFKCFKIQQISDLGQLKSCLYYHQNKYNSIQAKLKVDLICKAIKPTGRATALMHIKDILDEIRRNDIIRLINLNDTVSECEYHLLHFQQSLQKGENIRQQLLRFFDNFKIMHSLIYSEKSNYIESFRKHNQKDTILYAHLVENCFQLNLNQLKIDEIVACIWKAVIDGPGYYSSNQKNISKLIDSSNALLLQHYEVVKLRLSRFEDGCSNRKDIEDQINLFLQNILSKRRLIDKKETAYKELIDSITSLEKNLREISVIQPFFTFKLDDRVLYVSSLPISIANIIECLLLPNNPELFKQCVVTEHGSSYVKSAIITEFLLKSILWRKIDFSLVDSFLQRQDKKVLLSEQSIRNNELAKIKYFRPFATMYNPELDSKFTQIQNAINQEKNLIAFLVNSDFSKTNRVQQLKLSADIRTIQANNQPNCIKYFDSEFLGKLSKILESCKVPFHQIQFQGMLIAILQVFDISGIAEKIGVSKNKITMLQQNINSRSNVHTIENLSLKLCQLIPSFQGKSLSIQSRIQAFLKESSLQIKQGSRSFTKGCELIYEKGNSLEVEAYWPKESILVTFKCPRSIFTLTIPSTHYSYYSQIELLSLRSSIAAIYDVVEKQYQAEVKSSEEKAFQEEMIKQQQLNELLRIQNEREVQKLRAEEEKTRLRLNTEELNMKIKERAAAEQARLKFIEETTLAKLKESHEQQQRQQQKALSNKINSLSGQKGVNSASQEFLQFQVSLSEGQDQRFDEAKHCQAYDVEYDYRMTFYQFIKRTYHSLRNRKQIDVEKWLFRPHQE